MRTIKRPGVHELEIPLSRFVCAPAPAPADPGPAGGGGRDLPRPPHTPAGPAPGQAAEVGDVGPPDELAAFAAWIAAAGDGHANTRRGAAGHIEVPLNE